MFIKIRCYLSFEKKEIKIVKYFTLFGIILILQRVFERNSIRDEHVTTDA